MNSISICAKVIGHFKGRMRCSGEGERVETQAKNYEGLVSVNVIRLVVSASW